LMLVGESADLTPPQPPQKSSKIRVSNMSVPGAVRVYRELLEKILLVKWDWTVFSRFL
jgi:hypothetical protein